MTETTLALTAVDGLTVHGWLAALGAARVLAEGWPEMRMRWQQSGAETYRAATYPVFTGGPASLEEAVAFIHTTTITWIHGGVLAHVDPAYPPASRDWYGHPTGEAWPGEDGEMWRASLASPQGLLHPLLRLHAAQTVRTMLAKPAQLLAADRGLLYAALDGLGLDERYPAGMWLLRHAITAADSPVGEPGGRASPGRDWLAIMALPWMPPGDEPHPDFGRRGHRGTPKYRVTAPCWRWYQRPRAGEGWWWDHVMEWWLWPENVPAHDVPGILGLPRANLPGRCWQGGASRPLSANRYDPPYLRSRPRLPTTIRRRS